MNNNQMGPAHGPRSSVNYNFVSGNVGPQTIALVLGSVACCGYAIIWITITAFPLALVFRTLASKLGHVTGKNLLQVMKKECSPFMTKLVQAILLTSELTNIFSMMLGAGIALKLLLRIPLQLAILVLGLHFTFPTCWQSIQKWEPIEKGMAAIVSISGVSLAVQIFSFPPNSASLLSGLQHLFHEEILKLLVALLGAFFTPHSLFCHSQVAPREKSVEKTPAISFRKKFKALCLDFLSDFALFLLIMMATSATFNAQTSLEVSLLQGHKLFEQVFSIQTAPAAFALFLLSLLLLPSPPPVNHLSLPYFPQFPLPLPAISTALLLALQFIPNSPPSEVLFLCCNIFQGLLLPFVLLPLVRLTSTDLVIARAYKNGPLTETVAWLASLFTLTSGLWLLSDTFLSLDTESGEEMGGMGLWEWLLLGGETWSSSADLAVGLTWQSAWRDISQLGLGFGVVLAIGGGVSLALWLALAPLKSEEEGEGKKLLERFGQPQGLGMRALTLPTYDEFGIIHKEGFSPARRSNSKSGELTWRRQSALAEEEKNKGKPEILRELTQKQTHSSLENSFEILSETPQPLSGSLKEKNLQVLPVVKEEREMEEDFLAPVKVSEVTEKELEKAETPKEVEQTNETVNFAVAVDLEELNEKVAILEDIVQSKKAEGEVEFVKVEEFETLVVKEEESVKDVLVENEGKEKEEEKVDKLESAQEVQRVEEIEEAEEEEEKMVKEEKILSAVDFPGNGAEKEEEEGKLKSSDGKEVFSEEISIVKTVEMEKEVTDLHEFIKPEEELNDEEKLGKNIFTKPLLEYLPEDEIRELNHCEKLCISEIKIDELNFKQDSEIIQVNTEVPMLPNVSLESPKVLISKEIGDPELPSEGKEKLEKEEIKTESEPLLVEKTSVEVATKEESTDSTLLGEVKAVEEEKEVESEKLKDNESKDGKKVGSEEIGAELKKDDNEEILSGVQEVPIVPETERTVQIIESEAISNIKEEKTKTVTEEEKLEDLGKKIEPEPVNSIEIDSEKKQALAQRVSFSENLNESGEGESTVFEPVSGPSVVPSTSPPEHEIALEVPSTKSGGSLSRLSGLGRSARRQFAAILDDYWAHFYNLHGEVVKETSKKSVNKKTDKGKSQLGFTEKMGMEMETLGSNMRGNFGSNFAGNNSFNSNFGGGFGGNLGGGFGDEFSGSFGGGQPYMYNFGRNVHSDQFDPGLGQNSAFPPRFPPPYNQRPIPSFGRDSEILRPQNDVSEKMETFESFKNHSNFPSQLQSTSTHQHFFQPKFSGLSRDAPRFEPGQFQDLRSFEDPALTRNLPGSFLDASIESQARIQVQRLSSDTQFQNSKFGGNFDGSGFRVGGGLKTDFGEDVSMRPFDPFSNFDSNSGFGREKQGIMPFIGGERGGEQPRSLSALLGNSQQRVSSTINSETLKEKEELLLLRDCIQKLLSVEGSRWLFRFNSGADEDLVAHVVLRERSLMSGDISTNGPPTFPGPTFGQSPPSTLAMEEVWGCGPQCIWNRQLALSFGVWCVHRIFELSLMESRPELWGKYTFVLNRLQGIIEAAFAKPRKVSSLCLCFPDQWASQPFALNPTSPPSPISADEAPWPWHVGSSECSVGSSPHVQLFLDRIRDIETAVSSKKGRTGTAAGDVAFPKGKENLSSVLKRYKRRLALFLQQLSQQESGGQAMGPPGESPQKKTEEK